MPDVRCIRFVWMRASGNSSSIIFFGGGRWDIPLGCSGWAEQTDTFGSSSYTKKGRRGNLEQGGGGIGRKREKKRCEIGKFASLLDRYNGKKEALVNCEKCRGNGYFLLLTRKYYQRKMHFSHRKKGHSLNTSGVYIVKSKIIQLKMTQLKINTSSSCNLTFSHLLVTRILQSQPGYSSYSLAS